MTLYLLVAVEGLEKTMGFTAESREAMNQTTKNWYRRILKKPAGKTRLILPATPAMLREDSPDLYAKLYENDEPSSTLNVLIPAAAMEKLRGSTRMRRPKTQIYPLIPSSWGGTGRRQHGSGNLSLCNRPREAEPPNSSECGTVATRRQNARMPSCFTGFASQGFRSNLQRQSSMLEQMAIQSREQELETREKELQRKESLLAIADKERDKVSEGAVPVGASIATMSPEEIQSHIDTAIKNKKLKKAASKAKGKKKAASKAKGKKKKDDEEDDAENDDDEEDSEENGDDEKDEEDEEDEESPVAEVVVPPAKKHKGSHVKAKADASKPKAKSVAKKAVGKVAKKLADETKEIVVKKPIAPPGVTVSHEASRGQVRIRIVGEPLQSFKGTLETTSPKIKKHVKAVFKRLGFPVPAAFV